MLPFGCSGRPPSRAAVASSRAVSSGGCSVESGGAPGSGAAPGSHASTARRTGRRASPSCPRRVPAAPARRSRHGGSPGRYAGPPAPPAPRSPASRRSRRLSRSCNARSSSRYAVAARTRTRCTTGPCGWRFKKRSGHERVDVAARPERPRPAIGGRIAEPLDRQLHLLVDVRAARGQHRQHARHEVVARTRLAGQPRTVVAAQIAAADERAIEEAQPRLGLRVDRGEQHRDAQRRSIRGAERRSGHQSTSPVPVWREKQPTFERQCEANGPAMTVSGCCT